MMLDKREIRIETFTAAAPSSVGVHVNVLTVRVTHLPTGLVSMVQGGAGDTERDVRLHALERLSGMLDERHASLICGVPRDAVLNWLSAIAQDKISRDGPLSDDDAACLRAAMEAVRRGTAVDR